jgi:hypothetical protein
MHHALKELQWVAYIVQTKLMVGNAATPPSHNTINCSTSVNYACLSMLCFDVLTAGV